MSDRREYYAHTPPDAEPRRWHGLSQHAQAVADLAAGFAATFGAVDLGAWCGWLHDVGKFSDAFQDYLHRCDEARRAGRPGPRPGSAEHRAAGAVLALEALPAGPRGLIAACVQGHHGGLTATHRLKEALAEADGRAEVAAAIRRAREKLTALSQPPPAGVPGIEAVAGERGERARFLEMRTRWLFSCLVDADCLDTERHFWPAQAATRAPLALRNVLERWREALRIRTSADAETARADDSAVNRVRREVYEACVEAGGRDPGFFALVVPTGGGKTRSSLAFALEHAAVRRRERIVYAIPYTSIIDQTAGVFRDILGDEGILEHQSAMEPRAGGADDDERERARRMAAQNWDAPLVVTTTVQLFESLFANRTARCRKLHNLAQSVIVLDEVQTLPAALLAPIVSGLRELVQHYGATVVLCTATLPALEGDSPYLRGLSAVVPIVPEAASHFRALRRVTYRVEPDPWDWRRLADHMRARDRSCVAVLNTKKDALAVVDALGGDVRHLSTLLCGSHRRQVIEAVGAALKAEREAGGPPVLLVATQVIECGVDLDFPFAYRAMGPLDRIVQAAGRCNREGRRERGESEVVVFQPEEGSVPPGEYRTALEVARRRLAAQPDLDLDAPDVATRYFADLYERLGAAGLDREGVQDLRARGDFPEVAARMRLIANDTVPVLVPYHRPGCADASLDKEGFDALITAIRRAAEARLMTRDLWQRIQPLSVSVYRRDLEAQGALVEALVPDELYVWRGPYHRVRGIGGAVARDPADLMP
ncbi:MAG: CRISPR-associated helicase Cas3' [Chthonomonadales bacterium]|nr:CRISPR-associated helicase Cas3' [Chthonomonadales bacterium]